MSKSGTASKKLTPKRVVISSALACALTAALLLAASALISRELLSLSHAEIYTCVCMFTGSFLGTVFLVSGLSERKAVSALINAGVIVAVFIILGIIAGKGSVSLSAILCQLLCVTAGSITGCIPSFKRMRRRKR